MNVNEDLLYDMSYKNKNCIITVNYQQQPLLNYPSHFTEVLTCFACAHLSNWEKTYPLKQFIVRDIIATILGKANNINCAQKGRDAVLHPSEFLETQGVPPLHIWKK